LIFGDYKKTHTVSYSRYSGGDLRNFLELLKKGEMREAGKRIKKHPTTRQQVNRRQLPNATKTKRKN